MVRKVLLIVVFTAMLLSAGCQTVQGFGKDITWLGGGDNPRSGRR